MTNYDTMIGSTWFNVSADEPYLLQNRGDLPIYVKASATQPTNLSGSFKIDPDGALNDGMLSGTIWVRSAGTDTNLIVYAK